MAQVPLRMAQPGIVPPHQRPPLMVSMTQPPPVTMQGLVSMAPMMGPGGGMAVMTQAMNHPDSGHEHHNMNGPFHHPHHHHHPHHQPRPHAPSQSHHPVPPPPHASGPSQPPPQPHSAPTHSQYHPHPGGTHHIPSHSHHNGHHSSPHSVAHNHSGPPPHTTHMPSHSTSGSTSTHGPPQSHIQSGPQHMSQPPHSVQHHSPHQITGINSAPITSNQHPNQSSQHHQHHSQHSHHHPPMHQQITQQPPQPPPQQHLQHQHPKHQVMNHPPPHQQHPVSQAGESITTPTAGLIILNNQGSNPTVGGSGSNENTLVNGVATHRPLGGAETSSSPNCTASTREKTPMCLVNELARYNKISHQYCLTDEKGPAHKKTFTVTLKLGNNDEEYAASGPSIKKAQHSAAAMSLEKTKFKHPPPKTQRQNKQTKLTPTVELNALAMKRGEAAVYSFVEAPRQSNPYAYNIPPNLRNVYNQQKLYGRPPVYPLFCVNLSVGTRDFLGEGGTAQQAKHNAASKALKVIKALPMPDTSPSAGTQSANGPVDNTPAVNSSTSATGELSEIDANSDLKSPISLVHEIALKRNLTVSFEVVRESGPPHMRTFVTTCIVGDIRSQGEGTGKKVSKKRAAELMFEELRKLTPVTSAPPVARVRRKPTAKKKSRNLIKVGQQEQKAAPDYGQGINPISRLIQIQQAKKEKEPIYTLLSERGVPRRREFVMQVTVGVHTAQGSGPNKKLAKRAAAESMLQLLGYSRPQPQPAKPAIKMDGGSHAHSDTDKTRKQVTFMEETESSRASGNDSAALQTQSIPAGSGGRQLVPGLIMLPDGSGVHGYPQMQQGNANQPVNMQATAAIAKELLESGSSPTAKALSKTQTNSTQSTSQSIASNVNGGTATQVAPSNSNTTTPSNTNNNSSLSAAAAGGGGGGMILSTGTGTTQSVRPKDQLMYLANILNIKVSFLDIPKDKSEFLSLVTLSTTPPRVSHGSGPTIEASQDQACLTALRNLAEMGLDTVSSSTPNTK